MFFPSDSGFTKDMGGAAGQRKEHAGFYIRICLGVLRTLGLYINFHQCCVLAHAPPSAC